MNGKNCTWFTGADSVFVCVGNDMQWNPHHSIDFHINFLECWKSMLLIITIHFYTFVLNSCYIPTYQDHHKITYLPNKYLKDYIDMEYLSMSIIEYIIYPMFHFNDDTKYFSHPTIIWPIDIKIKHALNIFDISVDW